MSDLVCLDAKTQKKVPDLSKKVVAVYDVPKKAAKGARLLVKDFWSDATGEIELGLE